MRVIAILLIVLGGLALAYQGFSYISRERVAEVGPVAVEADVQRTVWIPPVVGGAALVAGALMLGFSGKRD